MRNLRGIAAGARRAATARGFAAFTLVELLTAMTVLGLIVLLVAQVAAGARRAWVGGERRTEVYQNGRAILELVARELRQAVISPRLQFIQDPELDASASRLKASSSVFWQANLGAGLCEVGYYLNTQHELKRFFVPPDDAANYRIFDPLCAPKNSSPSPSAAALWVTRSVVASKPNLSATVSGGVLGFWVRCLDVNGDPVPYPGGDAGEIKYNSADRFQPAVPGVRTPDPSDAMHNPSSFRYTGPTTSIAHRLPDAVELFVLTADQPTYARVRSHLPRDQSLAIGNPASGPAPVGIPGNVAGYRDYLRVHGGVQSSQVFSARVGVGGGAD